MNELEKKMVRFVCEEAYEDENPYEVCRNLEDCYKSFSIFKEHAYNDCEHKFSENVNYFLGEEAYRVFTFTRILSYNQSMFTMLQGAYYFLKDGSLIALVRYDTKTKAILRGFKMSKDGLDFKKSVSDIAKLIRTNK